MGIIDEYAAKTLAEQIRKGLCWVVGNINESSGGELPEVGHGTFCNNLPSPVQPMPLFSTGEALENLFLDDPIFQEVQQTTSSTIKPITRPPVYRPPVVAPAEIPERKLPQEADGQTDFDTPDGRSISLQQSLRDRKFGKLLWCPLTTEKIEVSTPKLGYLSDQLKDYRIEAFQRFGAYLTDTLEKDGEGKVKKPLSIWEKTAMAFTDTPSGLGGELDLMFGLKWFREIVNANKQSSKLALMKVHDFIPKEIKINRYDVNFNQSFSNENIDINKNGLNLENIEQILGIEFNQDKDDPDFGKLLLGKLPKSLLNVKGQEKLINIKSYPELFIWFIKQFDALIGEFPIKIKLKDTDLTEEGDQTKLIKIANIAEGLSELFGLSFQSASMGDASLHTLLRLIPEISRIRQIGLINQDILIANRDFLGYREKEVTKEIQSNFTILKDSTNIAKLLEGETVKYKSMEFDQKDTLMDYLMRLQYVASLQKQQMVKTFDEFQDFMEKQEQEPDENLDKWNEFLRIINDPTSQFNFGEKASRVRDVEENDNPTQPIGD